jgi:uncharacterized protein (UPF0261 family)
MFTVMASAVLLIGTLDTKGREVAYIRDRLHALAVQTLVLDAGILGEPLDIVPDIPHEYVARAAASTMDWLRNAGSRSAALAEMTKGVKQITLDLMKQGRLRGVICLGGVEGAALGAAAMRALPVGFPKILIAPAGPGKRYFSSLMGTRDIMVMHSVADLSGIDPLSKAVFDNAAAAMAGMTKHGALETRRAEGGKSGRKYVAVTMLGNTAKAVTHIRERLAERGIGTMFFHANGVGGPAMEELAAEGMFLGVIDYTTSELADQLFGGYHQGGEKRLERVGTLGLPQIIVPGCIDFIVCGPRDEVPARLKKRPSYSNNPEFTQVRLNREEMVQTGQAMARKLNKATGPLAVVVPTRGFSTSNVPGGVFWDPDADLAFLQTLMLDLRSDIPVIPVEAHINDNAFSERVADEFIRLIAVRNEK